ncbi:dTDP-4-dehydrorhamnose 3,5-epimerase [Candidatus Woesearchaeota archaeon]|jgi:dTDP-4-dehydrorhamnose 3,5-epimerase|nr:dTDP-4-dehydrorhamnose 3,5-epimerase [Candidatus Woesearchaeota archaeon]MBT7557651.1 dTDP-4-dehydrorhamnose 3,5-epimerase [Candidatus Woesearchaeota archaeon]
MSEFKVEIKTSKVFPEVKTFQPDSWFDYRGEMWTYWESTYDTPKEKISKFTRSRKNVLRGLHGDSVTWKHITCVWGEIYLVVVDNIPESENYLKWDSFIISERNHLSVLVPPGFANGHLCLSEECLFHYTQSYPEDYVDWMNQDTLKWDDPRIRINWPIDNPILNWRDK